MRADPRRDSTSKRAAVWVAHRMREPLAWPIGFFVTALTLAFLLACSPGGGSVADTGGISGTGISQGSINAFGSIFVNGVEWEVGSAAIEIDGNAGSELDLRLGMVVRVEGNFASDGLTGTATSVVFDDALEGPLANDPVDVIPGGPEKSFSVLGRTVVIHDTTTSYDGGASFAGLRRDDVVEISGFLDATGDIRATRVRLTGQFPATAAAELKGTVANLIKNPDGSGDFEIDTVLIHYLAGTTFSEFSREDLAAGVFVEVKGLLRITGNELDADEIELEDEGLGNGDADEVEVEGFVTDVVSNTSFEVSGISVDASSATFEPAGLLIVTGALVEVEGQLVAGSLIAESVQSEDEEENSENVEIQALVGQIDGPNRELVVLGVTVFADGETRIEDKRDGDENFRFDEIIAGDWVEIRGIQTGPSRVRALDIERDDERNDIFLEGPVTSLDRNLPSLSILDQPVPLLVGTSYFDALQQSRSEEEFFRNPGDVMLGDVVRAKDQSASDLGALIEADEVEISD